MRWKRNSIHLLKERKANKERLQWKKKAAASHMTLRRLLGKWRHEVRRRAGVDEGEKRRARV